MAIEQLKRLTVRILQWYWLILRAIVEYQVQITRTAVLLYLQALQYGCFVLLKLIFPRSRFTEKLQKSISTKEIYTPKVSISTESGESPFRMTILVRSTYEPGWKPDWLVIKKSPGSTQAQQLLDIMRELSLDLPVLTIRSKKPAGKMIIYTAQQLHAEIIPSASIGVNDLKDVPRLLMSHGTPLAIQEISTDSNVKPPTQYWYFESRLERELIYWAIKGAKQPSSYLINHENPWLSFMERIWLIWREQDWFKSRIKIRLQNILNKKSIELKSVHLPKRPPHFRNLQQLQSQYDLLQDWKCDLKWEEAFKLDITVDISGKSADLVVSLDQLVGPLVFSVAAYPSPLLHLHFQEPGPDFHLSINTPENAAIGIPGWLQMKLEKKIRKALTRQMVGNHSIIIDWSHMGSSSTQQNTVDVKTTSIEKSSSMGANIGIQITSGNRSGQHTPRTPERQNSSWGWALGLPNAGFLTPRPSVFNGSGGVSRHSSIGPADTPETKQQSNSKQHSRNNSISSQLFSIAGISSKDHAPTPPEKDFDSSHSKDPMISESSPSENPSHSQKGMKPKKQKAKRHRQRMNRPNTIVEDVD